MRLLRLQASSAGRRRSSYGSRTRLFQAAAIAGVYEPEPSTRHAPAMLPPHDIPRFKPSGCEVSLPTAAQAGRYRERHP